MARMKNETMTFTFDVKGNQARKEINDTIKAIDDGQQKIREINREMSKLAEQGKTNSARYKELSTELVKVTDAVVKNKEKLTQQRSALSLNELTIKELVIRIRSLRKEMETLRPQSKEWNELNGELKSSVARLKELRGNADTAGRAMADLSKVKTSALAAVAVAASVVKTVKEALGDIRDETQKWGDIIRRETAAAEAVWHQFIRTISSSRNEITLTWQEVAKLAREAYDLKDEIFELQNSYKILEAEATPRMQELEAVFRDSSKPISERKAALEEMKELELKLANDRLLIAKQQEDAAYDEFRIQTALDRETAESYIHDYLEVKKSGMLEEVKAYQELKKEEASWQGVIQRGGSNPAIRKNLDAVKEKIAGVREEVVRFYETYRQYNLGNDPTTGPYADAIAARIQAQAAASESAMDAKYARLNGQLSGGGGGGKNMKQSWSLQSDRAFLEAKAELTRKYNEGAIESQEEYDKELYQLEVKTLKARIEAHKDSAEDRLKIEADLQEKIMKHKQAETKEDAEKKKEVTELEKSYLNTYISVTDDKERKAQAQIAAENLRYQEECEKYEKRKSDIKNFQQVAETLERQHQNNLRKIKIGQMDDEIAEIEAKRKAVKARIESEYTERLALETTHAAEKERLQREMNRRVAESELIYIEQIKALIAKSLEGVDIGALSAKEQAEFFAKLLEYQKQLKSVEAVLANTGKTSLKDLFKGTGDGELFGVSQKDWETLFQNIDDNTLKAKDLVTILSGIGGAAEEGMKIASKAVEVLNAKEKKAFDDWSEQNDKKKEDLDKQLADRLMTQEQYNEAIEQMEAEKAAREDEMKLTQAKREKTMALVQAAINTALSVTKTIAQFGIPAGIAPAAIAAAMGAAQVALIAAKPIGYAEGGEIQIQREQDGRSFQAKVAPDKRGYINRPTILVGEEGGEYVIPAEALKNPDIRLCVDAIESARRSGRLRSLRMEAVNPAAAAYSGRADGGYTREPAPSDVAAISTQTVQDIVRLRETVDRLNGLLDAGIEAEVVMTGRNGLVRRFEEYNRMKERGQL